MIVTVAALVFLLQASSAVANIKIGNYEYKDRQEFVDSGRRCGVKDLTHEEAMKVEEQFEADVIRAGHNFTATTTNKRELMTHIRDNSINIYWFSIISEGSGDYSYETVDISVAKLNVAFGGLFTFNIKNAWTVDNADFFSANQEYGESFESLMKSTLHQGGLHDLNIYTTSPQSGSLGWATYPNQHKTHELWYDGVVIDYETLPGGANTDYNLGWNLVHQVGHWLGENIALC